MPHQLPPILLVRKEMINQTPTSFSPENGGRKCPPSLSITGPRGEGKGKNPTPLPKPDTSVNFYETSSEGGVPGIKKEKTRAKRKKNGR